MTDVTVHPRLFAIACAITLCWGCAAGVSPPQEGARDTLVATELAFARHAREHGIRPAFIEFFADDGINFQPGPVITKDALRARAPSDPKRFLLEWHPVLSGVSGAGDLGFTAGPSTLTDRDAVPSAVTHGLFLSVWRRDAGGAWHVVIDGGVTTPAALTDASFGAQLRIDSAAPTVPGTTAAATLGSVETAARFLHRPGVPSPTYGAFLADQARLFIDGTPPLLGAAAAAGYLAQHTADFEWQPIGERVAQSADLAYGYGKIHFDLADGRAIDGYYIHLWLRDRRGLWKLALDAVMLPPGVTALG